MKKIFPFLFLIALCIFLPKIASTSLGKKSLESYLKKKFHAQVRIETLSLCWYGSQLAKNVCWIDLSSGIEYQAKHIECFAFFFTLFHSSTIRIKEGKAIITPHGIVKALGIPQGKKNSVDISVPLLEIHRDDTSLHLKKTQVFLEDSCEIVTWGKMNLSNHQINLTVAFPAKSLEKLFKLKNLPVDFMLEVPFSGKLENLSLRKLLRKKAIKKLLIPLIHPAKCRHEPI